MGLFDFFKGNKIKVKYRRESVCMGDDVDARDIVISLFSNSTVEDLVQKILATKRSVAFYGPTTHWVLHSSAGDIADITIDEKDKFVKVIKYLQYPKDCLVKDINIASVYADRVLK